jgi:dihydrofolate reductase
LKVSIIAALADNGVIGRAGALPWHLPDDLRRFKSLTMGRPVLMGRRTFSSIGRALPGRRNLVATRNPQLLPPTVEAVADVGAAIAACADVRELCVIGGADIYRQSLPLATHLELTLVRATIDGDVYFPAFDAAEWREIERTEHPIDDRHAYAMTYQTLERIAGPTRAATAPS